MVTENFNRTIDIWINELNQYEFNQLCTKPAPGSWSLGQVYMHLISETSHFVEQIKICLSTNNHATEAAADAAIVMFGNNNFPDEILEGPPSNANTPQPEHKEQLMHGLLRLKEEINSLAASIANNQCKGKTKHPGLNYFNATEWLQFAEMHLRHHLRQKQRIENALKIKYGGTLSI